MNDFNELINKAVNCNANNEMNNNKTAEYFSVEMNPGLFLIGLDMGGEGVDGREIKPGHATSNSYLIVGSEKALLIDSMGDIPGFKEFAEKVAEVPIMFVLSHAHLDHIVRLKEFDEFWVHKDDEALLHGAYGMPPYDKIPSRIHYLQHGDVIDLGDRRVDVYNIKGHTMGSLLFLDRKTRTLVSGDTIARRLLYGISGWAPLDEFVYAIMDLEKQEFDGILSAHDRFILPKSHIRYMIDAIKKVGETTKRISLLGIEFLQVVMGNENEMEYQDITIPVQYIDLAKNSVKKLIKETVM